MFEKSKGDPLEIVILIASFYGLRRSEVNRKLCGDSYIKEYKEYIFVDSIGKIFRSEYITDHFSLLLKKQNLRHIRFHDLRHSCASLLLAKNIAMKAIQE